MDSISNTLGIVRDFIRCRLINGKQALPFIDKMMKSLDEGYVINALLAIDDLIQYKLITADQLLPYMNEWINDSNLRTRGNVIALCNPLIEKNLITVEQVLPFIHKALTTLDPYVRGVTINVIEKIKSVTLDEYYRKELNMLILKENQKTQAERFAKFFNKKPVQYFVKKIYNTYQNL